MQQLVCRAAMSPQEDCTSQGSHKTGCDRDERCHSKDWCGALQFHRRRYAALYDIVAYMRQSPRSCHRESCWKQRP